DFLARCGPASRRRRALAELGRPALLGTGLALLALAWFGLLRGFPRQAQGAAWGVRPDPALRRVAETPQRWRPGGRLTGADRGLHVPPAVADYCAWFCPDEKPFLDGRFALFGDAAPDFELVCHELGLGVSKDGTPVADWERVFRDRGVSYLVVYDPDEGRLV